MQDDILATVRVSVLRRWLGVGVLLGFGGMVIYVALAVPPALHWQLFLLLIGAGSLWMAERMRRATALQLELTQQELRCSDGTRIASLDEIEAVERGTFAFKPSNGFLIRTRAGQARAWYPGLWWRLGRRVGIGGVTSAPQTKAMSEILAAVLAERA